MTSKKRFPQAAGDRVPPAAGGSFQDPYAIFAGVYDEFMEHVPYRAWASYLSRRYQSITRTTAAAVTDLACGTGQLLAQFPRRIQRAGMDGSAAMLDQARQRLPGVVLEQGRLEERLPFASESQSHVVCTHDSLNYVTEPTALQNHFADVQRVLKAGGLYSIDIVSLANILNNFDNQTLEHRSRACRLVWKNSYDPKTRLMRSDLEFFMKGRGAVGSGSGGPSHVERHLQRYYSIDEIRKMAAEAGLETVLIEGDYEPRPHRRGDNFWNLHLRKSPRG